MSEQEVLAWHFLIGNMLRDGRPAPADGEWLEHEGELKMWESGLHASEDILDALCYAPGDTLCRVTCAGEVVRGYDKLVCTRRRVEWRIDARSTLSAWARWCALQVVHLWESPQEVVDFLANGDESLRSAARYAADSAAECAADSAAEYAAGYAAGYAAWAAAEYAAWSTARVPARAAQRAQLLKMIDEAREGKTEWVFEAPRREEVQP